MGDEREQVLSREEYIAAARQSCMQTLNEKNVVSKVKQKDRLVKKAYADEYEDTFSGPLYSSDSVITAQNGSENPFHMRITLIRVIFTMTVFLSIFVIDKFNLSYHMLSSSKIEEAITNNDFIEQAESFVINLLRGDKVGEEPVTETSGDKVDETSGNKQEDADHNNK